MLKVREARRILRVSGYMVRPGKGSHEIWTHPKQPGGRITLCGHDGDDLLHYQEAQLRRMQRAS